MSTQYCIYLRKSRQDLEAEARGEGDTLARHRRTLTELAEARSLPVGAIYEEVVSGDTIAARPQMQRLLQEVEAGQWRGVIVMEIERLARGDSIDQGIVARAFKYSETRIITPFKTFDPNNEYDEEYFEFGLFMSRREYKTIRRRLKRRCTGRTARGKIHRGTAALRLPQNQAQGRKRRLARARPANRSDRAKCISLVRTRRCVHLADQKAAQPTAAPAARRAQPVDRPPRLPSAAQPTLCRLHHQHPSPDP